MPIELTSFFTELLDQGIVSFNFFTSFSANLCTNLLFVLSEAWVTWHMKEWILIHVAGVRASSAVKITYELYSSSNTHSVVPLIQLLSDSNQIAWGSGLWSPDNSSWHHLRSVQQFTSAGTYHDVAVTTAADLHLLFSHHSSSLKAWKDYLGRVSQRGCYH